MEDFNLNFDNEIGTSVTKLKQYPQRNDNFDNDIDLDAIVENLNNSETFKPKPSHPQEHFTASIIDVKPKKDINNNARYSDMNLEKLKDINLNEPLPVNFTKNMIPKNNLPNIPKKIKEPMVDTKESSIKSNDYVKICLNYEHIDIILYSLLFIILNNKIIIELILKLQKTRENDSMFLNLFLRTLLFASAIYFIKLNKLI